MKIFPFLVTVAVAAVVIGRSVIAVSVGVYTVFQKTGTLFISAIILCVVDIFDINIFGKNIIAKEISNKTYISSFILTYGV